MSCPFSPKWENVCPLPSSSPHLGLLYGSPSSASSLLLGKVWRSRTVFLSWPTRELPIALRALHLANIQIILELSEWVLRTGSVSMLRNLEEMPGHWMFPIPTVPRVRPASCAVPLTWHWGSNFLQMNFQLLLFFHLALWFPSFPTSFPTLNSHTESCQGHGFLLSYTLEKRYYILIKKQPPAKKKNCNQIKGFLNLSKLA